MSWSQMSEFCYWSYLFQCARDQPTWHVGRWQWSCARCAGTGRGASWGRWRPSDAWQVGRRVRREGRLGLVTLLALATRHTWCAHAGTQGSLCTRRQVIDGPRQVLETCAGRAEVETTNLVYKGKMKIWSFITSENVACVFWNKLYFFLHSQTY